MSEVSKRRSNKSIVSEADKNAASSAVPKSTSRYFSRHLSLKILSRTVVIISVLIIVYISSNQDKTKIFAKQSTVYNGIGKLIQCSSSYLAEVQNFDGCSPKDCGRYISDKAVSIREAEELLKLAKKGLKLGGSSGGASILDLHSGALSLGERFINIYKLPEAKYLFTEEDFTLYKVVKQKVLHAVAHNFNIDPYNIHLTHPTFFSEVTAKKAITLHDEYWHPHVDKETYESFHYTTLLYLNDYNKDFKGGRFIFVDQYYNSSVEPRKARLSMFTSGAENLHYVEKVTSGTRYAITISFTCDDQYAIEDPGVEKYLE